MTTKKNKKRYYKDWRFWVGLVVAVAIFYCLPALGKGYRFFFSEKVNPNNFSISRLELLKLGISLIAPILTYRVFSNTLKMQDKAKKDREEDEKAEENRRNLDDANREFYSLLDLFKKEQNKTDTRNAICFLYNDAIWDKEGFSIINACKKEIEKGKDFKFKLFDESVKYCSEAYTEFLKNSTETLSSQEKVELVMSNQFDDVYDKTSSYFKIFHRILKSLNERLDENKLNERDYKNYIGVLRTQLSSEELVVILINSLFIKRGLGLGIELIGTNLFGDERDFKINQHFIIPKPTIVPDDLSIFINDSDGKNIEKRKDYNKKLKMIDDTSKFESIRNFKSFSI